MATKGPSNRYGTPRGKNSRSNPFGVNYQWAKDFNKYGLENHKEKHSKEFGLNLSESYKQHAIKFANTVDKKNCKAYVDENGTTYKFNRKTNELAIVNKEGYIISYYTVSDKFYYKKRGEKIWINTKKK